MARYLILHNQLFFRFISMMKSWLPILTLFFVFVAINIQSADADGYGHGHGHGHHAKGTACIGKSKF